MPRPILKGQYFLKIKKTRGDENTGSFTALLGYFGGGIGEGMPKSCVCVRYSTTEVFPY